MKKTTHKGGFKAGFELEPVARKLWGYLSRYCTGVVGTYFFVFFTYDYALDTSELEVRQKRDLAGAFPPRSENLRGQPRQSREGRAR